MMRMRAAAVAAALAVCFSVRAAIPEEGDPLPSWNDGPVKREIIEYVRRVTDPSGGAYIPPDDRIAAFDNDGTLWCEKPDYPQLALTLQYFGLMDPPHPSPGPVRLSPDELKRGWWKLVDGTMAFLRGVVRGFNAVGIAIDLHRGVNYDEYREEVEKYLATSLHPRFHQPYTRTVYRPMLELMQHLRDNGFRVFIVTAGGSDFVRVFSHKTYDVETSNVVGGFTDFRFRMGREGPEIIRKFRPITTLLRGRDKPVNIHRHIGKRPVLAVGNSDGDLTMLEYTEDPRFPTLRLLVHHDDPVREYAYDKGARKVLREARKRGWRLISMRDDWDTIFPFDRSGSDLNYTLR